MSKKKKKKIPETVVQTIHGSSLHAPAHPADATYVRVTDRYGREVAYWSSEEWEEDPCGVMGAIVGCLREPPAPIATMERELQELRKQIESQRRLDDMLNRCNAERAIPDSRGDYYSERCERHQSCRKER